MQLSSVTLNQISLFCFIAVSLLIGRSIKRTKTLSAYVLAVQRLSPGLFVMILLPVLLQADDLGFSSLLGKNCIIFFPTFLTMLIAVALGYSIFPRLTEFKGRYTIAELMEDFYGKSAYFFVKIWTTLFSLLIITIQFKTIGSLALFEGFSSTSLVLLLLITVTCYAILGGVRVVTATEVTQFFLVGPALFLLASFLIYHVGGPRLLVQKLWTSTDFFSNYNNYEGLNSLWSVFFLMNALAIFISPPVIQRFLMLSEKKYIGRIMLGFSMIYFFLKACFFLIVLCFFTLYPSLSNFDLGNLAFVLKSISKGLGFQSILLFVLMAIIFSTVDSFINSLLFLWVRQKKKKLLEPVGFYSIFFALLSLIFVILFQNFSVFEIKIIAFFSYSVLFFPFLAGVYGLRTTPYMFWIHTASFFFSFFIINIFLLPCYEKFFLFRGDTILFSSQWRSLALSWLFCFIISSLIYLLVHFYQHRKRFVFINRNPYVFQQEEKSYLQWDFFSCFHSPLTWSEKKIKICGKKSYSLGLFVYINYLMHLFFGVQATRTPYLIFLKSTALFLASGLLFEKFWPQTLKKYFNLFYFFTLTYSIPFITLITLFDNPKGIFIKFSLLLTIILLIALLDWSTFLLLGSLALGAALVFYPFCYHNFLIIGAHQDVIIFLSTISYTLIWSLFFIRKKYLQEREVKYFMHRKITENERQLELALFRQQQLVTSIDKQSSMMQVIEKSLQELKDLTAKNKPAVNRIKDAISHLCHIAFQAQAYLPLNLKKLTLKTFTKKVLAQVKEMTQLPDTHIQVIYRSKTKEVIWDPAYCMKLISNSWQLLYKEMKEGPIVLVLTDTLLNYKLGEKDQFFAAIHLQIAPKDHRRLSVRNHYGCELGEHNAYKEEGTMVQENQAIVHTHYGRYLCDGYLDFSYVLPMNVELLRPKIERFADEVILSTVMLHEEEDQIFLTAIQKAAIFDYSFIRQALQVAKHYHRKQKRHTGEAFYLHPLAVATILLPYTNESEVVVAALLHDTVEDTAYTLPQMKAMFGRKVAQLVGNLTLLYHNGMQKMKMSKKESMLTLLVKSNPNILLIKVADRLHNMRTIYVEPVDKQKRVAQETLHIFIPAAEALGLSAIAEELKRLVATILPEESSFHLEN